MSIYFDNSATTAVCEAAAKKAYDMMITQYGNPSSLHTLGIRAEQEMTAARRRVATLLGLSPSGADLNQITFTSGGTEANNLALFGAAFAKRRDGKHIVATAIEHPSVLEAMRKLEQDGFELTVVSPDAKGDISAAAVADACRPDTVLVAMMLVNNEIGTLLPVQSAVPLIRRVAPKAHIHCDAVQAAGKIPLKALSLGVDTLSLSGHKLHAPKGVGALYTRRGVRLLPRVYGGGQERGMRSGTEAVPAVAALGEALAALPSPQKQAAHYTQLRDTLIAGLHRFDNVTVRCPAHTVPYIVNFSVRGFKSETLVHFMAQHDIFLSAGSACAKGHESHVLKALDLPADEIGSALRISFCPDNTCEQIDAFLAALDTAVSTLARVK